MVSVDVIITQRVNEIANLEICYMRYQVRQQRVRTDVERYTEKSVSGALIELAVKTCPFSTLK